jgi:hypothetical protein
MTFSDRQSAHYQSSVTKERRKVMGWCRLLVTRIRNGHKTTVTTTTHWSREMAASLGPLGTLLMGIQAEPVTWTQHRRRVLWTYVSSVLTKWDASISRASPVSTKGDTCCVCASPLSQLKETVVVNQTRPGNRVDVCSSYLLNKDGLTMD